MKKNCLLSIKNKKINLLNKTESLLSEFADGGIYFERIEFCAFDDPDEIKRSVFELKDVYSDIVIFCPQTTKNALVSFIESQFSGSFDAFGVLNSEHGNVYLLTDGESRLGVSDVKKIINSKYGVSYSKSYIKTVGAPHAAVSSAVGEAKRICPDCEFIVSEKFGVGIIELVYPDTVVKSAFDEAFRTLVGGLNDYIYSLDETNLAQRLYQLFKLRRMKISVSESFTGGGVAKRLVAVPGISEVYFEGINAYANESKMRRLGVSELTLMQYGAVSEQTAAEMAEGLLNTKTCDVALSTTGIAGPLSDGTQKPVGLLYIGVGTAEEVKVFKYELKGSREQITETAINLALFNIFKTLK